MNLIPNEKYQIIKEMVKNGDEKAKDFLFSYMSMDDEKANEYLNNLTESQTSHYSDIIDALIKDENEAIDGYDKAIKFVQNATDFLDEIKEGYISKLSKIKEDELAHIKDLQGLK
jgi:gas vesicle protein